MEISSPKNEAVLAAYLKLRNDYLSAGLFDTSRKTIALQVTLHCSLFILSYFLSYRFPISALFLATVAAINLVWWIHDCGHDAIIQNKTLSKFTIEALGVLFLGMPQIEYHYSIHRIHHGFTNVLGKDSALDTGPVIWHESMLAYKKFLSWQWFLWIAFVLPLTYPLITWRCLVNSWRKDQKLLIGLWAMRWLVFVGVFHLSLIHLLLPIFIAGFVLGLAASLNHFPLPIMENYAVPFPGHVFLVTQNLAHTSAFATWLTGGLNFHIEHHLFPTMPSRNYKKISPEIQKFAQEHRLPYHSTNGRTAVRNLIKKLKNPKLPVLFSAEANS